MHKYSYAQKTAAVVMLTVFLLMGEIFGYVVLQDKKECDAKAQMTAGSIYSFEFQFPNGCDLVVQDNL